MGFDLSKNNVSEMTEAGYEFELVFPGAPTERTGAFIKVRGKDSTTVQAFDRKRLNTYWTRNQVATKKGKDTPEITLSEIMDAEIDEAVVRVINWRGIDEGGVPVAFTKENAERIFREHGWIAKQIKEESDNILNFFPAS